MSKYVSIAGQLLPAEVFHPMDILADELRERGWNLDEFAMRLCRFDAQKYPVYRLALDFYALRDPDCHMSAEDAGDWQRVLGPSSNFWLNTEIIWREHRERTGYVSIAPELEDENETPYAVRLVEVNPTPSPTLREKS